MNPETSRPSKTQFIRDLQEKDVVTGPFLVKFSAVATGKTGKPYMNLVLMDRTGEIEARLFEDVPRYVGVAVKDAFVRVEGRCQIFQNRKQIVLQKLQVLREDEVIIADYLTDSGLDANALYKKLLAYVDSMSDPHYRALAQVILRDDAEIVDRFKRAPAAKGIHHAYRAGLLEHVVSITGLLDALAAHYGAIVDRDLLFLGGFFHDIGKLWELSYDGPITDYTTEGRLIGHHVMGVELIEAKVQLLNQTPGALPSPFPLEKKLLVKHVIIAHHGKLEYGSPKEPQVLEAQIVHMIDDLDSKVNAISKFVENDQTPGPWTALNRQFTRFFYRGERSPEQESL